MQALCRFHTTDAVISFLLAYKVRNKYMLSGESRIIFLTLLITYKYFTVQVQTFTDINELSFKVSQRFMICNHLFHHLIEMIISHSVRYLNIEILLHFAYWLRDKRDGLETNLISPHYQILFCYFVFSILA